MAWLHIPTNFLLCNTSLPDVYISFFKCNMIVTISYQQSTWASIQFDNFFLKKGQCSQLSALLSDRTPSWQKQPFPGTTGNVKRACYILNTQIMTDDNSFLWAKYLIPIKSSNRLHIHTLIWYVIHCITCRCSEVNKQYSFKVRSGLMAMLIPE